MKSKTLPVKRRPAPNGIFRRLNAVTRNRKQRVAATASTAPAPDMDEEDSGSKISRALTIIFLIHIIAIALIFVHQRFLDGRPAESTATVKPAASVPPASERRSDLPRLSSGDLPYVVQPGDNYARIATAHGVDERELSLLNEHIEIGPGQILKIPPKRIVAVEPPEVAAIRDQTPVDQDRGLVEAVDVSHAPKARLVRPNAPPSAAPATITASGNSYVVQPGDSIFRIASRFKVSQEALMQINGITNPRKMRTGMTLVIPQS